MRFASVSRLRSVGAGFRRLEAQLARCGRACCRRRRLVTRYGRRWRKQPPVTVVVQLAGIPLQSSKATPAASSTGAKGPDKLAEEPAGRPARRSRASRTSWPITRQAYTRIKSASRTTGEELAALPGFVRSALQLMKPDTSGHSGSSAPRPCGKAGAARRGREDRDHRHRHRLHPRNSAARARPQRTQQPRRLRRRRPIRLCSARRAAHQVRHRPRRDSYNPTRDPLTTSDSDPDPNPLDCNGHGLARRRTAAGSGVTSAGATTPSLQRIDARRPGQFQSPGRCAEGRSLRGARVWLRGSD